MSNFYVFASKHFFKLEHFLFVTRSLSFLQSTLDTTFLPLEESYFFNFFGGGAMYMHVASDYNFSFRPHFGFWHFLGFHKIFLYLPHFLHFPFRFNSSRSEHLLWPQCWFFITSPIGLEYAGQFLHFPFFSRIFVLEHVSDLHSNFVFLLVYSLHDSHIPSFVITSDFSHFGFSHFFPFNDLTVYCSHYLHSPFLVRNFLLSGQ